VRIKSKTYYLEKKNKCTIKNNWLLRVNLKIERNSKLA